MCTRPHVLSYIFAKHDLWPFVIKIDQGQRQLLKLEWSKCTQYKHRNQMLNTHSLACTHARTNARTHAHTHIWVMAWRLFVYGSVANIVCFKLASPLTQWWPTVPPRLSLYLPCCLAPGAYHLLPFFLWLDDSVSVPDDNISLEKRRRKREWITKNWYRMTHPVSCNEDVT